MGLFFVVSINCSTVIRKFSLSCNFRCYLKLETWKMQLYIGSRSQKTKIKNHKTYKINTKKILNENFLNYGTFVWMCVCTGMYWKLVIFKAARLHEWLSIFYSSQIYTVEILGNMYACIQMYVYMYVCMYVYVLMCGAWWWSGLCIGLMIHGSWVRAPPLADGYCPIFFPCLPPPPPVHPAGNGYLA